MFHAVGPGLAIDEPEPMTKLFVKDLEVGIADTGVRAGFLKCAIDHAGMAPGVERVLREEGVDLAKVALGHSGDTTDLDYLVELADGGSYLGMDRFGSGLGAPERVDTIRALIDRGYVDQLLLSHDAMCFTDYVPPGVFEANPDRTYSFIPTVVLPMMRDRGITETQIDKMLRLNPQRYLSGVRI
jgi:phosphotriesterase-related protein